MLEKAFAWHVSDADDFGADIAGTFDHQLVVSFINDLFAKQDDEGTCDEHALRGGRRVRHSHHEKPGERMLAVLSEIDGAADQHHRWRGMEEGCHGLRLFEADAPERA
jgi:hypothetical protein